MKRFFGKRGDAVIDANLAMVAAAYDSLIDVSAAVTGVPTATPGQQIAGGTR